MNIVVIWRERLIKTPSHRGASLPQAQHYRHVARPRCAAAIGHHKGQN
jgi:hypothetical protein